MNDHIFWRDEVLQLLFWMRGEGMGEAQDVASVARYLSAEPAALEPHLRQMAADGYLTENGGRISLTESGVREGARRFQEEFEPLLGQGHGECSDPDCDCHALGPAHCKAHVEHGI